MNANAILFTDSGSKAPLEEAREASKRVLVAEEPFLRRFDPHQTRLLIDCSRVVTHSAGELIFRQGDPANRFYVLRRGRVELVSHDPGGGATLVQTVGPGEVVGWSWLFPPYYWHSDARAVEPTEALFFYGTPLREECAADHEFGYELIQRMAEVMVKRLEAAAKRPCLDPARGDSGISRPVMYSSFARAKDNCRWGINE